ncbi:MAG: hypothetical protein NUV93_04175 [Firmicutes bacterium]|jgi:hypothetical protein|nr:hypothetical protein [Bacillota bacterium]
MNTRLTQRELLNCQDVLGSIIESSQMFQMIAQECNDQELRRVCQDLHASHQRQFQTIMKHLGGGAPQVS